MTGGFWNIQISFALSYHAGRRAIHTFLPTSVVTAVEFAQSNSEEAFQVGLTSKFFVNMNGTINLDLYSIYRYCQQLKKIQEQMRGLLTIYELQMT
jgi:hypothetical protein